jgi:hypothetical protein
MEGIFAGLALFHMRRIHYNDVKTSNILCRALGKLLFDILLFILGYA